MDGRKMRDLAGGIFFLVIFTLILSLALISRLTNPRKPTLADSIAILNSVIELDIRTIRAQNDTNWMYIDSTSYYRTKFLVKREALWLCLERER